MPRLSTPVLVAGQEHAGKFVAFKSFSDRTVVASGKDARAAEKGYATPVVFFVPPKNSINIY
jgi:hypothetical protein